MLITPAQAKVEHQVYLARSYQKLEEYTKKSLGYRYTENEPFGLLSVRAHEYAEISYDTYCKLLPQIKEALVKEGWYIWEDRAEYGYDFMPYHLIVSELPQPPVPPKAPYWLITLWRQITGQNRLEGDKNE